jgi:uncharacterized protein (DUF302 family)
MSGAEAALGIKVRLEVSFEMAEQRTVNALRAEGFGVLTEIDVRETLKQKLGVDFRPYKILGACNPPLAHRALTIAPDVGLMLPCNVTLSYVEDGVTEVAIVDPLSMLGVVHVPALEPIAEDARARLLRIAAALQQG